MYLARQLTHASLAEIGRAFGGKDQRQGPAVEVCSADPRRLVFATLHVAAVVAIHRLF